MRQTATLRFIVAVGIASLGGLVGAVPAAADPVTLVPSVAGQPSRLEVDADPRTGAPIAETPRSVTIAVARGLRIDTRARDRRCLDEQARNLACPERSRIGRGYVEVTISGYLPNRSFDAIGAIDLYLAPATQPGDIAGVIAQVTELVSGRRSAVRGRLVRVPRGRFGAELVFSGLPGVQLGGPLSSEVKRLRLFVWASRSAKVRTVIRQRVRTSRGTKVIRQRVVQRVRYNLLNNPGRCTGSWPYEVRFDFPSGTKTQAGRVACTSR